MALWLLASVWCLLLIAAALSAVLGNGAAFTSYAASAALVLWARPRRQRSVSIVGATLAGASGWVALPAWLVIVAIAGAALGLERPRGVPQSPSTPLLWLANVALAPLFEELLYRERVLPALRARVGAPFALILSSAAFAAPHLEPWSVLTTFLVGFALGGVFLASDRVELCIAHHAGLN
ncbi:MAG: lysostaphin resistance A-like protein, partial [Myxococcota bacterium]